MNRAALLAILNGTAARPAFGWDFTRVNGLPPGATFTRASGATYFDSTGVLRTAANDAPRFDHDPVTKAAKGLLIEEQRTNTCLQSNALTTTWNGASLPVTAVLAQALGPDGTLSLASITATGGASEHSLIQTLASVTIGASVSLTAYARKGTTDWAIFGDRGDASYHAASFNLNTGVAGTTRGNITSKSIEHMGGGLYKLTIVYVREATSAAVPQLGPIPADNTLSYTPAGTPESIFGGFVQNELGAFPTSYIPTTTAAATRNADVATVALGAWFNAAEGTLFVRATKPNGGTGGLVSLDDGSFNESYYITAGAGPGSVVGNVYDGGVVQAVMSGGAWAANAEIRAALSYKVNDFQFSRNGSTVTPDTAGTLPTPTTLSIGRDYNAANNFANGWVQAIKYFNRSNSQNGVKALTA